jgi:hypothetical protein
MLDLSPERIKSEHFLDEERTKRRGACIKNCTTNMLLTLAVPVSSKEKKEKEMQCRFDCLAEIPHVPRIQGQLSSYRMWLYPSDTDKIEPRKTLWKLSEELLMSAVQS